MARPRSGFTIVELIGTCFLLTMVFSMTIPMFVIIARERRSSEQRQFALQHAANLLEQTSIKAWRKLELGDLPVPEASEDLKVILPGLERSLTVRQVDGELASRQITVSVKWRDRSGQTISPVVISTWVYPEKGDL